MDFPEKLKIWVQDHSWLKVIHAQQIDSDMDVLFGVVQGK